MLMIFIAALLLTIAGIAIDLGNMYRWRVRLERAARAGVAAGLGYRTLNGWQFFYNVNAANFGSPNNGNTQQINRLRDVVQDVISENLTAGFAKSSDVPAISRGASSSAPFQITGVTYNPVTDRVTATVSYKVPTYLMSRVFGGTGIGFSCESDKFCEVTSGAQSANMRRATIAMFLDTSGSMECPENDTTGNCACRTTGCPPPRKIDRLREAAQDFIKYFNPFRDRIAVIPFNLGASDYIPIVSGGTAHYFGYDDTKPNDRTTYDTFMNSLGELGSPPNLPAISNTNHCDALVTGYNELNAVSAALSLPFSELQPFSVFFTDGAPNAMVGTWTKPFRDAGSSTDRLTAMNVPQPWYQYSLEWADALPGGTVNARRGPSMLVNKASVGSLFNFQIATLSNGAGMTYNVYPAGPATVTAGPLVSEVAQYPTVLDGNINPNAALRSLTFALPGLSGSNAIGVPTFAETYVTPTGPTTIMNTDQLYYFCPIAATDYHRTVQSGTVFAIGLGMPAPACNDPAQDADNSFLRKDYLLGRMAFDPVSIASDGASWFEGNGVSYRFSPRRNITISNAAACSGHRFRAMGITVPMIFGYDGGLRPDEMIVDSRDSRGSYFGVNNANLLRPLFQSIAKRILLRLAS